MKTLRLIFPQWQGADIARWAPEVPSPADSARGASEGGVLDRSALLLQARAALAILDAESPDRAITLGGE